MSDLESIEQQLYELNCNIQNLIIVIAEVGGRTIEGLNYNSIKFKDKMKEVNKDGIF